VFFGFVFIGPALNPETTTATWITEVAVVAVCAPLYVVAELRRWVVAGPAALLAIGVGATVIGSGSMAILPVYAAALAGLDPARRVVIKRLAIISVVTLATPALTSIPWPFVAFLLIPVIMVWVVGLGVHESVALEAHAGSLAGENARIAYLSTVAERERIARDLHDLAGQALTSIIIRSQLVARTAVEDPQRAIQEAAEIESTARDTLGLGAARPSPAGSGRRSPTNSTWRCGRSTPPGSGPASSATGAVDLAPPVESVMALALREAVTNVVKHARAAQVTLGLETPGTGVRLTVSDDGVGISGSEGSGIRGMRERVVAAGGSVTFDGAKGTRVSVEMPFGAAVP
jgi:two-component system, NarL family, sensor histidine kinase DesK